MATQLHGLRIVALGDSITEASSGDITPEKRWPVLVERALAARLQGGRVALINSGVGGNTSREGLARFDRDVAAHHPDIVLVQFGGNDATPEPERSVSLEEFERNTLEMLQRCRAMGAHPVLLTFPPLVDAWHSFGAHEKFLRLGGPDGFVEQYRALTRTLAQRTGTPIADIDRALRQAMETRGAATQILPDGVHLREEGNQTVAARVTEVLQRLAAPIATTTAGCAGESSCG